jgi:hypothetical protein
MEQMRTLCAQSQTQGKIKVGPIVGGHGCEGRPPARPLVANSAPSLQPYGAKVRLQPRGSGADSAPHLSASPGYSGG